MEYSTFLDNFTSTKWYHEEYMDVHYDMFSWVNPNWSIKNEIKYRRCWQRCRKHGQHVATQHSTSSPWGNILLNNPRKIRNENGKQRVKFATPHSWRYTIPSYGWNKFKTLGRYYQEKGKGEQSSFVTSQDPSLSVGVIIFHLHLDRVCRHWWFNPIPSDWYRCIS